MFNKFFIISFLFIVCSLPVSAHTFTGMIGFYDGLSHPVLGMDHFLAMVSVGIISAQVGGRAIWTIPTTFVGVMIIGGIFGITAEINKGLDDIRPFLHKDGGDVTFIKVTSDFELVLKLEGACRSCEVNQMTLKNGIEESVKKYAPEIKSIKSI